MRSDLDNVAKAVPEEHVDTSGAALSVVMNAQERNAQGIWAPNSQRPRPTKTPEIRHALAQEEITRIREEALLRLFEFNITTACQLRCPGCYKASDIAKPRIDLPLERYKEYIAAGVQRGLEEIWLLGGEPTLHPQWKDFVLHAREQDIEQVKLFSNMLALTEDDIQFLMDQSIFLVGKLNIGNVFSPDQRELQVQAAAIGRTEAIAKKMLLKIQMILSCGLQEHGQFALENLIRSDNTSDVLGFWSFCREHGVIPNMELLCDVGASQEEKVLVPTPMEIQQLVGQLKKLDEQHGYDSDWEPMVPHIINGCPLNYTGIAIEPNEDMKPCAASPVVIANFADQPIDFDHALLHPVLAARRQLTKQNVKGLCQGCEQFDKGCYGGCRNAVEIASGDPYEGYNNCFVHHTVNMIYPLPSSDHEY